MHQLLPPDYINTPSSRGVKSTRKTEAAPEAAPLLVLPSPPPPAAMQSDFWPKQGERQTSSAPAKCAWPSSPGLLSRMVPGQAPCRPSRTRTSQVCLGLRLCSSHRFARRSQQRPSRLFKATPSNWKLKASLSEAK